MKTHEKEVFLKSLFLNLIILNLVFVLSVWIGPNLSFPNSMLLEKYLLFFNFSWIITQFIFFSKSFFLSQRFIYRIVRISNQILVFLIFSFFILSFVLPEAVDYSFILGYCSFLYMADMLVYFIVYKYLGYIHKKGLKPKRVLIVGFNETGQFLHRLLESNPILGYKFIGFLNDEFSTNPLVIGHPKNLAMLINKHNIQTVFVVQSYFLEDNSQRFLDICDTLGVRLWMISTNYVGRRAGRKKKTIDGLILINPKELPLDNFGSLFVKRTFDILFSSLFILFIMSWLFPILALLIKLSSKGPVFFIQKRTGLNNSVFNCYKFRTMCVNDKADVLQATDNDMRITSIGNFLRKTNIDEFPQFLNVLLGHMSVVGPRPHMLKHTDEYSALINGYLTRHFVKPGITGWAQVNGLHGETDQLWKMEKRVEYDIYYMNNWTLWLDIKIVPMTVFGRRKYLRYVNMEVSSHVSESILEENVEIFDSKQSD